MTDSFDALKVEELRNLAEEEIIRRHDKVVDHANTITTVGAKAPFLRYAETYRSELLRRETERQGKRMEALTRSMHILTWVGVGVAVVGAVLTAITLLSGASPRPAAAGPGSTRMVPAQPEAYRTGAAGTLPEAKLANRCSPPTRVPELRSQK